ncbi:MAG: hypothetical protein IT305_25695 [Chloroflexi bacterium]|nr:hypothetical protein [Chloroflexota bacterium]
MKIAIVHLTRMQPGYVCVAGLDVDTGAHVRPVFPGQRLRGSLTARQGGPFDIGVVVDLGRVRPTPVTPEHEDHEFERRYVRVTQRIEPRLYWDMLSFVSRPSLGELFGPALQRRGKDRAGVEEGTGEASLGCFRPRLRPSLYVGRNLRGERALRMSLRDPQLGSLDLSVTDLRLYDEDGRADERRAAKLEERIARGAGVVVGVGLTRAFRARADLEPLHWLQVNNLHLEDDPTCSLGCPRHISPCTRPRIIPEDELEDLPF